MKAWAVINTADDPNSVVGVYPVPDDVDAPPMPVGDPYEWLEISDIDPLPEAGWTYDGTTFTEPVPDVNRRSLTDKMQGARASNATFMGLGSPTNAQLAQQVRSLTRQVNSLMRIASNDLDTIDDT